MAKSNLLLLKEAIEAGDLERAKALTDKIAKKAPRKPAKASAKVKATKVPSKAKKATQSKPAAVNMDESSYIASSKKTGDDLLGNRHFIGEDGKQHIFARRVSMAGTKFVNKFDPNEGYRSLSVKDEKFNKKLNKKSSVHRRPPAEKIRVQCSVCKDWFDAWEWEVAPVPGDSERNFRCDKKKCTVAR